MGCSGVLVGVFGFFFGRPCPHVMIPLCVVVDSVFSCRGPW